MFIKAAAAIVTIPSLLLASCEPVNESPVVSTTPIIYKGSDHAGVDAVMYGVYGPSGYVHIELLCNNEISSYWIKTKDYWFPGGGDSFTDPEAVWYREECPWWAAIYETSYAYSWD